MKKYLIIAVAAFALQSCIVSTAAKAVTGVAKLGYSAVKGTVKGISWAVKKAEGKIDKNRLDGTWKVVGLYNGSYNNFIKEESPDNAFSTKCAVGFEEIVFKARKEKFQPVHCSEEDESWVDYKFKFGKNPQTREKENYLVYQSKNYISIIDVTGNTMVLEGSLMPNYGFSAKQVVLLEKVK